MTDVGRQGYRAFLAYSHRDGRWAKRLHRALESHRIDKDLIGRETPAGPVPETLRPIFRDREDFAAGHSLDGAVARGAEGFAIPDRDVLAGGGKEPLRQRGGAAVQSDGPRRGDHSGDRGRRARRRSSGSAFRRRCASRSTRTATSRTGRPRFWPPTCARPATGGGWRSRKWSLPSSGSAPTRSIAGPNGERQAAAADSIRLRRSGPRDPGLGRSVRLAELSEAADDRRDRSAGRAVRARRAKAEIPLRGRSRA